MSRSREQLSRRWMRGCLSAYLAVSCSRLYCLTSYDRGVCASYHALFLISSNRNSSVIVVSPLIHSSDAVAACCGWGWWLYIIHKLCVIIIFESTYVHRWIMRKQWIPDPSSFSNFCMEGPGPEANSHACCHANTLHHFSPTKTICSRNPSSQQFWLAWQYSKKNCFLKH